MALYNRQSVQESTMYGESVSNRSELSTFIRQTYQLFAASLLAGSAGAFVGLEIAGIIYSYKWLFIILEFGLLFGLFAAKRKAGLNLILLFAFTFVSGLTVAPMISMYLARGAGAIVAQSFILTTVAFGSLSVFAMNTKKDFTTMGKALFITLIVVVVAGLINMFFNSPMLQLAIASVSSILFSFYILYDTQNIIRGAYETPIEGAVSLYLDFFNLFLSLLQILGFVGGDD